jgi:hypothetical protein
MTILARLPLPPQNITPQVQRGAASRSRRRPRRPPSAAANKLIRAFAAAALLALLIGALGPAGAFAQTGSAPPEIQFQKSFGGSGDEEGLSIQQTADGGFIAIGASNSNDGDAKGNHGEKDMWIVKLSASGSLECQKQLGGSGDEEGSAIQQTADGGYIAVGFSDSDDGDAKGNRGKEDMWVVKLSGGGELEWQKQLGGSGDEEGRAIQQTADGGFVAIGSTQSNDGDARGNHGREDMWVVKLSAGGDVTWQKSLGGSRRDEGYAVQQTSDGGFIAIGSSRSNNGDASGNHGRKDMWVVKLSGAGELEWQKSLGGSGNDEGRAIQLTPDGGCVAIGLSDSTDGDVSGNHGGTDFWAAKLSAAGGLEWQKSLGGSWLDAAAAVQQTADGGFIAAGFSGPNDGDVSGNHGGMDAWVVKLAPPAPSGGLPDN